MRSYYSLCLGGWDIPSCEDQLQIRLNQSMILSICALKVDAVEPVLVDKVDQCIRKFGTVRLVANVGGEVYRTRPSAAGYHCLNILIEAD